MHGRQNDKNNPVEFLLIANYDNTAFFFFFFFSFFSD